MFDFESLGLLGLALSSFLAATILPFTSEALVVLMVKKGISKEMILIYASIGNILGSAFNYWIGHLGKLKWAEKYLKITHEQMLRWQKSIDKYGALISFWCFLPIIGDPISLALGYFRVRLVPFLVFMGLGKVVRYAALIYLL